MNIQTLALILLAGRAIAITFNILVLRRQWKIRKIPTHPRIEKIRKVLSALAVVVFIANLYPLWLDIVTLWDPGIRTSQYINLKGLFYPLDNNLGYRDWETDRKSTRLNSSHSAKSRMPSSA